MTLSSCATAELRVRPLAHGGFLIVPLSRLADIEPPFAVRLEGTGRTPPVFLHVDRVWDFSAIPAACGTTERCAIEYDRGRDVFECSCGDISYRPDGQPVTAGQPPLTSYPVLHREEVVLIDVHD